MKPSRQLSDLVAIMAALRHPETGCPWDVEQDFASIAPYTVEEAHEVAEAIQRGDMVDLCDELGDLLLQVVFHARMAEEARHFALPDVIEAITTKLIRRHPHVFGDKSAGNPGAVKSLWEAIKSEERAEKAARKAASGVVEPAKSLLDGVPPTLPALTRAVKLQKKASTVGFDWNDPRAVLAKLREEIQEVEEAFDKKDTSAIKDEIGDMLFVIANLARHADIEPEGALEGTNMKFRRRFAHIEAALAAQGRDLAGATLEEMDALWDEAKALEKRAK
ncbi:MAG: nucleoside triphosphate pyrophosphohydrolase [Rhizobiales bacterium PAR1]|nr:MAG: nucleoside triphosphate pyrophosphohydrolase [Rhizobiales bacterium PAR1]